MLLEIPFRLYLYFQGLDIMIIFLLDHLLELLELLESQDPAG